MNDPFGEAIKDYFETGIPAELTVNSNYTADEKIPVDYLFRTEKQMPGIEKKALALCKGKTLDVGAAAGCHSIILQNRGIDITALERSKIASEILVERGIKNVFCENIFNFSSEKYDTILLLMNGAGIGGTVNGLVELLIHLKTILNNKGQILIDSSDIKYLFEEDDGSYWIDLNSSRYYGEMEYEVKYKSSPTQFKWLFIDFEKLVESAERAGLRCKIIEKGDHFDYLARITN